MTGETTSEDKAPGAKKKTWLWVVGGLLVVGFIGSTLGGGDADTDASPPPAVADGNGDGDGDGQVTGEEQDEEEAAEPAEPVTPEIITSIEQLEAALSSEIGDETNMGLPRDITVALDDESNWLSVTFVANENFTTNLTRSGMWRDIGTIFDLARKWDQVEELTVTAQFPLLSNLGEELGPQDVLTAYFDTEVYPRINTANLSGERLGDAASFVRVHPALQ